ncbi:MAG: NAD(P)/FAD-dependent oxidoreductase [Sulfolobales archaeon]
MRIGVVGGGIGGLLAGVKISDSCDVDLYEEHYSVGYPKHCTGLISERVLNYLGSEVRNYVLNSFDNYVLIHTLRPAKELRLKFRDTIHLIDRPATEKYLSEEFQGRRGSLKLGLKVNSINSETTSLIVGDGSTLKYDVIIVAEGARAILTKSLGMCSNVTYLVGIQSLIKLNNDLDSPYVFFGDDISHEFFGWAVPANSKELIVGFADRYVSYSRLNHLIKTYLIRKLGINELTIKEVFGGLIPISKPCKQTLGSIIGIGDAVSVVKPLSGGGVYGIANQVKVLKESLSSDSLEFVLERYNKGLINLITTLKIQHILRRFISKRFNSLSNFVMKLIDSGINEITISNYDKYVPNLLDLRNNLKIFSSFII